MITIIVYRNSHFIIQVLAGISSVSALSVLQWEYPLAFPLQTPSPVESDCRTSLLNPVNYPTTGLNCSNEYSQLSPPNAEMTSKVSQVAKNSFTQHLLCLPSIPVKLPQPVDAMLNVGASHYGYMHQHTHKLTTESAVASFGSQTSSYDSFDPDSFRVIAFRIERVPPHFASLNIVLNFITPVILISNNF